MTLRLVDVHHVAPPDVEALVALVRGDAVPIMEDAGASFESCGVAPDLDDDGEVMTVWTCTDFVEWNRIRRNLMFDPRYHAYGTALAALRRRGTRRFYADELLAGPAPDDHGPAIRRWEMFTVASEAPATARERLWRAMRDCDRFIPGITRCAVGTNVADGPIELVWETTYASVGAYATTYMTHPYHAALLDRFLLPDCPERITTPNSFGAGLIGYTVDRVRPLGPVALRRLLLLDFTDPNEAAAAAQAVAAADDGWSESILAENTMATRWFDGETDLGGRPDWSHIWDQCFASVDQYEAHRRGDSQAAGTESSLTVRSAEVVYTPASN
ncbi:MAG TPA: Dabb family protein [Acidimicrobiia bacterium]